MDFLATYRGGGVMPRYVDVEALNAAIEEWFDGVCVYDVSPSEAVNDFQSIVDEQPTISPDEVRGVWKWKKDIKQNCAYYVSNAPVIVPSNKEESE